MPQGSYEYVIKLPYDKTILDIITHPGALHIQLFDMLTDCTAASSL